MFWSGGILHRHRSLARKLSVVFAFLLGANVIRWNMKPSLNLSAETRIKSPVFDRDPMYRQITVLASAIVDSIKWLPSASSYMSRQPLRTFGGHEAQLLINCVFEDGTFYQKTPSAPFRWSPNNRCFRNSTQPTPSFNLESDPKFCRNLRGKKVLLVGDRIQYTLHAVLVARLSSDISGHHCAGAQFCNWHPICFTRREKSPVSDLMATIPVVAANWSSHMGLLRYCQSSSLYLPSYRSDRRLNEPFISPATEVRDDESNWKYFLSTSHLVVLSKGPIPAPKQSYEGGSFDLYIPRLLHDQQLWLPLINNTWSSFLSNGVVSREGWLEQHEVMSAIHATTAIWLPHLITTLTKIRNNPSNDLRLIVWRGEWFACPPKSRQWFSKLSRGQGLDLLLGLSDQKPRTKGIDPWLTFHNVQVSLQSQILRMLLPKFDILYLPAERRLAPCLSRQDSRTNATSQPEELAEEYVDIALLPFLHMFLENI